MAENTQSNWIELVWKSVDQTSDVLKSMGTGVDQFGDNLSAVTEPAASLTSGLLKIEAAAIALGAALGGIAIAQAIKFESAAADLNKVLDTSDGSLEQFKNQALEISDAFGVSADEVLQTAATFKEAGFSAADAFTLVRESLTLTKISELDAAAASEALVAILKGFGSDVAEVPRIMDIINEVTNKYATGTVELTDALARVSPVAKQSGFTFEETAATLTIMLEVFRKSELVTSAFNTTMVRLVSDTKDVAAGLAILGVKQLDNNLVMKSGAQILKEVQQAFGKLPETQKLNVAAMLSGTDQGSKMVIVFDNLALSAKIVGDALAGIGKSVKEEFEKRMQATEVLVDRMKVGFENLGIVIGTKLLPHFGGVVESATKLVNVFRKMIEEGKLDVFFAGINDRMEGLNIALWNMAESLPAAFDKVDFTPLIEQFKLLGVELDALGGDIDLTSVDGLAEALQFAVDATTKFIAVNRGMLAVLPVVLGSLKTIADLILWFDPMWFKMGGTILASLAAINLASGAFTLLSGAMTVTGGILAAGKGLMLSLDLLDFKVMTLVRHLPLMAGGLTAVAGGFGVLIGSLINMGLNQHAVNKGFDSWGHALYYLTHDAIPDAVMSTREHAKVTGEWAVSQNNANEILTDSFPKWNEHNQQFHEAIAKTKELTGASKQVAADTAALTAAFGRLGKESHYAAELAAAGFTVMDKVMNTAERGIHLVNDVFVQTGISAKDAAEKVETALEKAFAATQKARDQAEEFRLSWAKLESEEQQLVFQVSADIQVAKIEAEASKVIAAFQSIDEAIKSTGETMSSLVEAFVGIESGKTFTKSLVEGLIKEEQAMRKQAFELQKRLVDTQIKYLEASTERLKGGDALITIKGDGLADELRAFMFKILDSIQIEASANGSAFLLGLPGV